ncbi:MAG: formylglycine-generating enzyme family protein [Bacteroidota bacterium]
MKQVLSLFIFLLFVLAAMPQKKVKPGQTFRDCQSCPEMIVIPAGSFMMGAPPDDSMRYDEEGPVHRVTIHQFAVAKFDITTGQWAAFASATHRPSHKGCLAAALEFDSTASWCHPGFMQEENHPVVCLSWDDVQDYLQWINKQAGGKYRLLTEAEWEYAARAGTATTFPWGTTPDRDYANYGNDSCCSGFSSGKDQWVYTSPVDAFPPNQFGLYDMNGNVLQFVQDCFSPSYTKLPVNGYAYNVNTQLKMSGDLAVMNATNSCDYRMLRGGDWGDPPRMIRSAFRNWVAPPGFTIHTYRSSGLGFRIAKTL